MLTTVRFRVIAFLTLTYGFSAFFWVHIAAAGKLKMLPTLGLMWCPAAAATIVRLVSQRNLRGTGWEVSGTRWEPVSYVLPAALGAVVYGLVWLTGIGGFSAAGLDMSKELGVHIPLPVTLALIATVGLISSMIFSLGEEIGWRGFLVPELATTSTFTMTALISGAAWSLYHYPLILFANYNGTGTPTWFSLIVFTWMIVASSFIYAWLRLKSGSVWTAVILHGSHNLFIQQVFDPLTVDRSHTKYVTTEFGVGLAIGYSVLAYYFWRRRGEVEASGRLTV